MLQLFVRSTDIEVPVKQWRFPCGEVGVSISDHSLNEVCEEEVGIVLKWESNDDIIALAQLCDILKLYRASLHSLLVPYFPYSRQDRRVNPGEAHALKVVGSIINSLDFGTVISYDAHSYVLEGVVDNFHNVSQAVCARDLPVHDFLVAPDQGASKKIYTHGQVKSGKAQVLVADKARDACGNIIKTTCHDSHLVFNKTVCVVDDICDGGATFIELGKLLRQAEPKELNLYVTHGFFTKGLDALKAIYDNIYVHNLARKEFTGQVKEI